MTSPRFQEASRYAAELFKEKKRKGTAVPYVAHLFGVASLVLYYNGNEDEAIAGLLHDAVEDQGGAATREMIEELYGSKIVDLVSGCSDTDQAEISRRGPPEKQNASRSSARPASRSFWSRLPTSSTTPEASSRTFGVTATACWKIFNVGRDEQLEYFNALIAAFKKALGRLPEGPRRVALTALVHEYAGVVQEIESGSFRGTARR